MFLIVFCQKKPNGRGDSGAERKSQRLARDLDCPSLFFQWRDLFRRHSSAASRGRELNIEIVEDNHPRYVRSGGRHWLGVDDEVFFGPAGLDRLSVCRFGREERCRVIRHSRRLD